MSKKFDIKIPIKKKLKKGLIFGIRARPPIGILLSFLGFCDEVMPILQVLSHSTRAFIINANGLPGFIVQRGIINIL